MFAFEIACVDHDVDVVKLFENVIGNRVGALPVSIGEDCNSHVRNSSCVSPFIAIAADYTPVLYAIRRVTQWLQWTS
jgi:hypothetical protein